MAESLTDKLKLSKRDTGDINWGQGANANLDAVDQHAQQATLRPPRTLSASLGSGAVGANLLGSTTYFYKITAVNAAGETTEGKIPTAVEAQVTESASPVPVILSWETVKGATGYKIYKSTLSGQEKFLASVVGESTAIYTDDGNTAVNGAISVPAANTARTAVSKIVAGANVTVTPPDGTGEVTINASSPVPPDASTTVKGVSKLSAAPTLATDPIAVGDNDPRNANARTPSGAAAGDLSGTYPNPTVAKVNGTSVPASPSAGQVLTATGAAAASWQTPAGGGGYATVVVAAPTGVAATDTANIQNAINSIGIGTVILREGLYVVNTTITLKSRITIRGQGKGEFGLGAPTTLKCDNAMGDVPLFDTFTLAPLDLALEDFSIDINGFTRAARIGAYDIRLAGIRPRMTRIAIANSSVTINIASNNINEQDSAVVDECIFIQGKVTGGSWINIQGKVTNSTFIGNTATGGFQSGLVSFGQASVVTGCVFRTSVDYTTGAAGATVNLDTGVLNGRAGSSITGCTFIQEGLGTATRAIQVADSGSGSVSIVGNYANPGTACGTISVRNAGGTGKVTIVGNSGFNGYSGGSQAGNDGQTAINSGGAAGGDLSGTYPNPAVAKVNGTAVPASPTAGQVLTATGPTAATWQTPAPGGYATVVVAAPTGVAATDTANIQAALNSIPVAIGGAGGGVVILRQGIYVVNQITIFNEGTKLSGSGPGFTPHRDASPGSSLQAANPLSADMLVILASQVLVENISFKGFGLAAGFALVSGNMGNTIFRDCAFVGIKAGNIGIKATTGQDLKILDCMFQILEQSVITVARTPIAIKVGAAGGGFSQNVDIIGNHFMIVVEVSPTGAGSIVGKAIEMTKVFKAVIERNQIEGNSGFSLVTGVTTIGVELFTDGSAESKGVAIGNNNGRSLNNFIRQTTAFPKVTVCGNNYIKHVGSAPVIDLVTGNTNWAIAGNVIEGATGVNLAVGADSNVVVANIANVVNAGAGNSVVNNVAPL